MSPSRTARAPDSDDDDQLDRVFRALADRTRRAILRRLSTGSATVTELAVLSGMSLPGVSKHLTVLEQAGLVVRTVQGRVRRCSLKPGPLHEASTWLAEYRSFWESALDSLAGYVATAPRRDEPGTRDR
jgi:DNA-binding transcriptional ArsR family regulator